MLINPVDPLDITYIVSILIAQIAGMLGLDLPVGFLNLFGFLQGLQLIFGENNSILGYLGLQGFKTLKTILNKVEKYKSFVYAGVRFEVVEGQEALVVDVRSRTNAKPECPVCGWRFGRYDTQPARLYEYVPLWGFKVFFRYRPRRANCPVHGVKVEHAPWAQGKEHQTTSYKIFLAGWAKRLSWLEVARIFDASWNTGYRAVKYMGLSLNSVF